MRGDRVGEGGEERGLFDDDDKKATTRKYWDLTAGLGTGDREER